MRNLTSPYLMLSFAYLLGIPSLLSQDHHAIVHVTIPSISDDSFLEDQTIEIMDGKIKSISSSRDAQLSGDVQEIDGTGKFLMPGLSEMHAHIPIPKDGDDANVRETLFLYLANGITTIRGMLGDPYHLILKKQVMSHSFPSPRIYTSSPSLNGTSISTKEEAITKVIQYADDGYDFLKIHPGIKREVFDAMAQKAKEVGITFSGHVPVDVGIRHAIKSKYATIDHLDGYIEGLAPDEKKYEGGFFGVMLYDDLDESKIDELVQKTKDAGIAIVPTQTLMTRWLSPVPAKEMIDEPEMKYIPAALRFTWRQSKERMLSNLSYKDEDYRGFVRLREKIIKSLFDADVPILLGSDAPQVFNVPGFSIHHEMQDMAKMGLTPRQIIRSGSSNVAAFFGKSANYGSIEVGKVADLVLVNKNPVEDIANASEIEGVMYRGHWLSKLTIDEKLAEIAIKYE